MAGTIKIKDINGNWIKLPVAKGDKGDVGKTPILGIGIVESLPAGSTPEVNITGTTNNPVFNLKLPVGNSGINTNGGTVVITNSVNNESNTVPSNKAVSDLFNSLFIEI